MSRRTTRGWAGAGIATTLAALLAITASAAPPTLTATATNAVIGGNVQATAQLSESPNATGTISFEVFGPGDPTCAGPPVATPASATVTGEGAYASGQFTPPSPGTYRWSAHYSGDGENAPADSVCSATSEVAMAAPTLAGAATPTVEAGQSIDDSATLSAGFSPSGQVVFRAFGPGDDTCAGAPAYEATVPVSGDGAYSPAGFAPPPGLYRWTTHYSGDANNLPASTPCNAPGQLSAVGTITVTLTAEATGGAVGSPFRATATIQKGAIPGGQLSFKAFAPGDANCSGSAAFSSTISVSGNGKYISPAFVPTRVGAYRWTVAYSGDATHGAAAKGCGAATSNVGKAAPSLSGTIRRRVAVGARVRDIATLAGGYAPSGTITFRIYAPGTTGCAAPAFVDTVAVTSNGAFSSDPFVPPRPGLYRFVASYSGDALNQEATEPCGLASQAVRVYKRAPKVLPRAQLIGRGRISIRARLSGAASPSGVVRFRLYRPGDRRCQGRPAFSGGVTVAANGTHSLAEYLAAKPGTYRLRVGYSGDQRNKPYEGSCANAQPIRAG